MTTPSFLDTLRSEVALLQAQYPERADEISRACALIAMGMVHDLGDGNGQVLSSDGARHYRVNGHCECSAAVHGKHCKHLSAWRLYGHIQRKLTAYNAQEGHQNIQGDSQVIPGQNVAPTPLPEAPASVNVRLIIDGRDCQLTLRDSDEGRLLARLQAVLAQHPAPRASQGVSQGSSTGKDWCVIHNVTMKFNEGKNGKPGWHSHKTADGQWCKGKQGR